MVVFYGMVDYHHDLVIDLVMGIRFKSSWSWDMGMGMSDGVISLGDGLFDR